MVEGMTEGRGGRGGRDGGTCVTDARGIDATVHIDRHANKPAIRLTHWR